MTPASNCPDHRAVPPRCARFRAAHFLLACMLGVVAAGVAAAGAAAPGATDDEQTLNVWTAADDAATGRPAARPKLDLSAAIDARKSYAIPPLEIIGFDVLLNRFNRLREGPGDYDVTAASIRRNARSRWVVDNDPFSVNQFLHPYQGSMYHGFARSAGLNYWEALGYTFAGSAFWEVVGENTLPSRNDQIASGIAGTFLGEALFRMASLSLERDDGLPQFWHELAAAAISPSTGINRLAFGERFKTVFPSRDPAYYSRLNLGFSGTVQNAQGLSTKLERNEAVAEFAMDYGLPGKPGYSYTRPFDYFTFQTALASGNGVENIMTGGILLGRDYAIGASYRGIAGLFGRYDYLAPQIFRMSSTALSLGSVGQVWLTESVALQGTGMMGVGYAAVGHPARHRRARLPLRRGAASDAGLAADRRRQVRDRPRGARVLRQPRRRRGQRRQRQHRQGGRGPYLADHRQARGLAQIRAVAPRRVVLRNRRPIPDARHHRPLLHAARP
ncbi:MAG: DUF3943 domain-containing protein [Betaproteobacteria bacterium]|nr:DUF3943 domain-containing protein [Betaproteobacteria bacterium]